MRYPQGGQQRGKNKIQLSSQIAGKCIFRHSFWLQKHSLCIVNRHCFFQWISVENTSILSCLHIYFFVCSGHFFVGIVEVYGECWRKVDKKETYNLPLCLLVDNNPKSKKNSWIRWKIFQGVFEKKKHMKRLSFITKIEFLLLFTNCRKVLRKMPALSTEDLSWY